MPTGLFTLTQVNQAIRQGAWTGFIAPTWVEYLVVAGGGGGGYTGGGGAGGLLTGVVNVLANTSYTVTVGSGGAGGTSGANNNAKGVASVFGNISADGGGAGGINDTAIAAKNTGGSGGGGGIRIISSGQGTAGQGNAGGLGSADNGGGGGGAGTVGLNATTRSGNGGSGIASAISGVVTTYAGGGGGGIADVINSNFGSGGVGGGGSASTTIGQNGGGNTGGGGGGASFSSGTSHAGGAGGSGIVIIRYPGTVQYFTGGTLSYANGYVIHTFYSSGTLAPTTPTPYVATDYQISRSLRFNSADSAFLNRTPGSAGNRTTWTWSGWVKLGQISTTRALFSCVVSGTETTLYFGSDNKLFLVDYQAGAFTGRLQTTQVFRDPSAWYHIVAVWNTASATAGDRMRLYVNGSEITAFDIDTQPPQNTNSVLNTTNETRVGGYLGSSVFFDGYMTEVNFIDGQALTPSSFGYYDFNTGVWTPTRFVGTYGTNGFYLNFSDNSNTTAATLGRDYSGNSNNWTPNNFSVSAGAGNDSLVDVPTNWGTDTGVGGTVRGNYCTWNPLAADSSATITNGNLDVATAAAGVGQARGTIGVSSGKWYWEVTRTTSGANLIVGIVNDATGSGSYPGQTSGSYGYYGLDGTKINNGTFSAYGASFGSSDVIGVALDLDAGTLVFYKNGTSQGTAFTGLSGTFFPAASDDAGGAGMNYVGNFGQRPFAYTAPSGFRALNTQNLPTPTIGATTATQAGKFFNPVLYTGNGTTQSITGVGFQPDLVWVKSRSSTTNHVLIDVLRGVSRWLGSNDTAAEFNSPGDFVTAFNSDGFSVGPLGGVNSSAVTYVGWNWRANGAGVTNTAGSITSTVSANTTSGFSVVTYTTPSSGAFTFGHGLGAAPAMVIAKARATAGLAWVVYHRAIGPTQYLALNGTGAAVTLSSVWNDTAPTSTVVSSTAAGLGASQTYVAYCFAEVPGYSRFGSYTGNGSSDGPFVFCGFRPAYVMVKCSAGGDGTANWVIKDKLRAAPYNPQDGNLYANLSNAEDTTSSVFIDFLSNGFKVRGTYGGININGGTFIFAAFAEAPQKFALAR